jgi:hypothetical protein
MKLFGCQHCGQAVFFENTRCERCGHRLGYWPDAETVTALVPAADGWTTLAEPARRVRFCSNAEHDVCNWLVDTDGPDAFCVACRHNRTIPDLSAPANRTRWRTAEAAKRRLFYSLLRLRLPLGVRPADPEGLAFDFLVDPDEGSGSASILTGHDNGLITLNLAEADDAERERRRSQMGEAYRTLLGHFRHEVGHYYWDRLLRDGPGLARFRAMFGDERADYGEALRRHYAAGPRPDWPNGFVSAYAASHPWEDFAETWAHYLHMVDTLETAQAFGLRVGPHGSGAPHLAAVIDFDPYTAGRFERLVDAWLPLTTAVNALNRSMGLPDLYPFVLPPAVIGKLAFIHETVLDHRAP